MSRVTRLIGVDDAAALAQLVCDNREFLEPWDPLHEDGYFTEAGQRAVIEDVLGCHAQGTALPHVILDASDAIVGRITLSGIVRGPFESCSVGYWVSASHNGHGLATAAVREIIRIAFDDLKLHRIQAGTLLDNVASQRVLERNGFVRFGLAPQYLKIAGKWQDHLLFQVVNPLLT